MASRRDWERVQVSSMREILRKMRELCVCARAYSHLGLAPAYSRPSGNPLKLKRSENRSKTANPVNRLAQSPILRTEKKGGKKKRKKRSNQIRSEIGKDACCSQRFTTHFAAISKRIHANHRAFLADLNRSSQQLHARPSSACRFQKKAPHSFTVGPLAFRPTRLGYGGDLVTRNL